MAVTLPRMGVGTPSARDMIFSCVICQRTLSDIYGESGRTERLRRRPGSPRIDQITKFWLTECAHLTCGEHFEGGGVPSHPEQEPPSAPCPFCCKINDARPKKLLFINGTSKGEYDSEIPDSYFDIPPPQVNGPEKGSEGLRFQYLSLIRYSTTAFEKLHRWEARGPEIIRQLDKIRSFRKELTIARSQLLALQQNTSSIDAVLAHEGASPVKITNNRLSRGENKKAPDVPNNSPTARDTKRPTTMDTKADDRQVSVPPINLTRERTNVDDADRSCTMAKGSRKRRGLASFSSTRLPFSNQSVPGPSRYWELPFPSYCRPPVVQARTMMDDLPGTFQRQVVGSSGLTSYHAAEPTARTLQADPRNNALLLPMLDHGLNYTKVPRSSHVAYRTPWHRGTTPRQGISSHAASFRLPNTVPASDRNPFPPNINFNEHGNRTTEDGELQPGGLKPSNARVSTLSPSGSHQACSAHGSLSADYVRSRDRRSDVSAAQTSYSMMSHSGDRPGHHWSPV